MSIYSDFRNEVIIALRQSNLSPAEFTAKSGMPIKRLKGLLSGEIDPTFRDLAQISVALDRRILPFKFVRRAGFRLPKC